MAKVSSASRRQSSAKSKSVSRKSSAGTGSSGKAGKTAKLKSGLGKVSGGKSKKVSNSKGTGKSKSQKSQKAGEMQGSPFKALGNLLGGIFGGSSGSKGVSKTSSKSSGSKSGTGKTNNKSASGAGRTGKGTGKKTYKADKTPKNVSKKTSTTKSDSSSKDIKKNTSPENKGEVKKNTSPENTGEVKKNTSPETKDGKVMGEAKGTGYYPHSSKMEGGYVDKKGNKLQTLQDYMDGKSKYVSIALDKNLYKSGKVKYGDSFRIPELEKKYGREIDFRAVDTGGAFTNKGFSRVDICNRTKKDTLDPTINGKLTLVKGGDNPSSPSGNKVDNPGGAGKTQPQSSVGSDAGNSKGSAAVDLARKYLDRSSRSIKGEMPHFTAAGGNTNNCADFVSSALQSQGLLKGHYVGVSDGSLQRALKKQGYDIIPASQARAGDVWISGNGKHTELVQGVKGKSLSTIGSNNVRKGFQKITERTKTLGSGVVYARR